MKIEIPAIDNITEGVKYFLQKVITPPLEEVGLLFADKVKLWRFKNQVNMLTKAENHLTAKGLKTRKVSLKVLTPMLEYGSLEEDESLQDKWAALFANTVKEGSAIDTTLFSHILSQLSQKDAELFEFIHNLSTKNDSGKHSGIDGQTGRFSLTYKLNYKFTVDDILRGFKDSYLSMDNLIRLRLVRETTSKDILGNEINYIELTSLGFTFMAAVQTSVQ
jgi:hypothetical protein